MAPALERSKDATREAWDATATVVAPAFERSATATREAWDATREAMGPALERSKDATREAMHAMGPASATIARTTRDAAVKSTEATIHATEATIDALTPVLSASKDATLDAWEAALAESSKAWENLRRESRPAWEGLQRELWDMADSDAEIHASWARFQTLASWGMPPTATMAAAAVAGAGDAGDAGEASGRPTRPPVGERCSILASRRTTTDICRVAEQLVMDDMPTDYWPLPLDYLPLVADEADDPQAAAAHAAEAAIRQHMLRLACRERSAFFVSDRIGELTAKSDDEASKCEVRRRRAVWAYDLQERYGARVLEWVDTAVSLEKQAAVIWLHEENDEPIILVAWRGSKQLEDFLLTDTTMGVILTPLPDPTLPGGSAPRPPSAPASEPMEVEAAPQSLRPMMAATEKAAPPPAADEKKPSRLRTSVQMLDDALGSLASNPPALGNLPLWKREGKPACTVGLWRAYAGDEAKGRGEESPRARVRRAVEAALEKHPTARLCTTGHSLGGALATLCAYDLLTSSPIVAERGCSVLSLAGPRFFDHSFHRAADALERTGKLRQLRLMVHDDLIPQLPPKQLGLYPGVRARLILDPSDEKKLGRLRYLDEEDEELDQLWGANVPSHTCHSIYLGAETTPTRQTTLPPDGQIEWPLVKPAADVDAT